MARFLFPLLVLSSLHAAPLKPLADAVGTEFVNPETHDRVSFLYTVRGVWGSREERRIAGWQNKESKRLMLDDGFLVGNDDKREPQPVELDQTIPAPPAPEEEDDPFPRMRENALGLGNSGAIPHAAWLAALGRDREATEVAKLIPENEETSPLETWQGQRVWFHFAAMVHAFMQEQDDEALAHGEFLAKRYPDLTRETYPQAADLVADLRRRKEAGEAPGEEAIGKLPEEAQIDSWIRRLEDINVMQSGQPGGVDLGEAAAVQALIRIGEPAMPKLIECFESDNRLTRSVHFWRDFHQSRTVLGVHEAALVAIMSILRTEFYSPAATGSNLTSSGPDRRAAVAGQLRTYWETYGAMDFPSRMMKILTDRSLLPEARREAASNLASPFAEQRLGTTVWTGSWKDPGGDNPWIKRFTDPPIHTAMLSALDDELAGIRREAKRRGEAKDDDEPVNIFGGGDRPVDVKAESRDAMDFYMWTLRKLGDPAAVDELRKRMAIATDPTIRAFIARSCDQLGDHDTLATFAKELAAGELDPPGANDRLSYPAAFDALVNAEDPKAADALVKTIEAGHPWRETGLKLLLTEISSFDDLKERMFYHPWCLAALARLLEDRSEWEEDDRICDAAARQLHVLLGNLKDKGYEPSDEALKALGKRVRRNLPYYRELDYYLYDSSGFATSGGRFLPILPPLGRAATALDVSEGKAHFHLENPANMPEFRLPLNAWWHPESGDKNERHEVVILQAERDADGGIRFGVSDGNGFHVVPDREIGVLYPIPDP
ncbi:hypothetical protein HAHE_04110 [Haloferula helveola]|uniref:Uncharacterized protein n=1 Tax=Haloferula helveola TaxID=490095 RepID=A0ABM7R749_9BACT|nr:hypothetical protein HAHE_04110 [Haloferula helveola]